MSGTRSLRKLKKEKNKDGRPPFVVDYEKLSALCRIHCTEIECAAVLGCHMDTLSQCLKRDGHGSFPEYFKIHSSTGKVSLRRRQWRAAVEDGNVTMMIWLGKNHLGQRDQPEEVQDNSQLDKVIEIIRATKSSNENSSN